MLGNAAWFGTRCSRTHIAANLRGSKCRWRAIACNAQRQRRHSWQLLELGFVALFCLVLALTLWLNQDSRSCAAKLYRDPVTGRMVNLEPTPASGKMRIMCARLGYPER